jgi:hypothetical protein
MGDHDSPGFLDACLQSCAVERVQSPQVNDFSGDSKFSLSSLNRFNYLDKLEAIANDSDMAAFFEHFSLP